MKCFKVQLGLSLVELLISMTLGLLIVGACLQIYLFAKQQGFKQSGLIRIQENARIIHAVLGKAIESSGKMGCNAFSHEMAVSISADIDAEKLMLLPLSASKGLNPQTIVANSLISEQRRKKIKVDSDIFHVNSVESSMPVHHLDLKAKLIFVKANVEVNQGQIVVLSDCAHALIAKVQQVEHNKGFTKLMISSADDQLMSFAKSATVGLLNSTLYYVADTGRTNASGNSITSLYKTNLNGRTIELVEGVEDMRIDYGAGNNEAVLVPYNKVQQWSAIRKIRGHIILNSIEDANTASNNKNERLMKMPWTFEWLLKKNHGVVY